MQRVLVIGTNGAGKTTFSRKLSEITGLPLVHIDRLYWRGNWETTPREEYLASLSAEAEKESWIIDGNGLSIIEDRLRRADTVFWLELPSLKCVINVVKREMKYRGTARPDMPEGCIERIDPKFLRDVWRFNRKNRKRIRTLLGKYDVKVVHIKSHRQSEKVLEKIKKLWYDTKGV